ncbi:uncharacterized protein VTP21DRAFT_9031 [Calcarisporiella thermophila]|uniref:uncharacterized protein n=1 Tax=Calcarisporiella thermophila TaxID=911321 RepID=UPI00374230A5
MATKAAYKRLTKEYLHIQRSPPDFIIAKPLESNILEWHYVLTGPPDSPYTGGEYHGKLTFPPEYPFKPPAIRMITPNGRFQVNTRLCLTMSDFHPSSWNPSWSVATILNGLLSFMLSDEVTTGSIKTTTADKRIYAARSRKFNRENAKFREVFPELCIVNESHSLPAADIIINNDSTLTQRRTQTTPIPSATSLTAGQNSTPPSQSLATSWFSWSYGQWRRWLVVFAFFVYLLLAKLIARSSS